MAEGCKPLERKRVSSLATFSYFLANESPRLGRLHRRSDRACWHFLEHAVCTDRGCIATDVRIVLDTIHLSDGRGESSVYESMKPLATCRQTAEAKRETHKTKTRDGRCGPTMESLHLCGALVLHVNRSSQDAADSQLVNTSHERKKYMKALLKNLIVEESGQDIVEYALLAGFISLIAVAAVGTTGTGVNTVWNGISAVVAAISPVAAP